MIIKLIRKIINLNKICHVNKDNNCSISFRANIDKVSIFEGRNVIFHKTIISNSIIGYATYVSSNCILSKTRIGRYCSIGTNVKIIAGNHPTSKYVSTHPIFYSNKEFAGLKFENNNIFKEYSYTNSSEEFLCEIGNDVWVGDDVRIINGVTIGDGAIIAAGAVVSSSIPPYAIVGGVPAKLIKYRFTEEAIAYLLEFKWWDKEDSWLKKNVSSFPDVEKFIMNGGIYESIV